ncbi:uncharacterized protein LOC141529272 [Cotesia typhae]|uniref:uncharacterized protein LOC141529272 n=1 Tax=Cotesia typhae TaxID=2053667 RepID=UPI003D69EA58
MISQIMKQSRGKSCWWFLGILLFSIAALETVWAAPVPEPGMVYSDPFLDDTANYVWLQKLKQIHDIKLEISEDERELSDAQLEIQAMLEANVRNQRVPHYPIPPEFLSEDPEALPVPEPRVNPGPTHSGKRTSYMALCHFKICNMGRKRQLPEKK